MLPRFHAADFATVGFYLGILLYVLAALMLVPTVIAVLFNETACVVNFLLGVACCFALGSLLQLCPRLRLDRRRSYLLAASAWIVLGVMAAIPLYFSGSYDSFLDATFDTVSSITTTGVTLMEDIDHMAYSQITWRTLLALLGAQGVIVIGLYLGFFGEGSYSSRVNAQARHESLSISLRNTSKQLLLVVICFVVGATIIAALIGIYLGLEPADSIMNGFWLSASSFASGSFVPHKSSLIYYHSSGLNAFLAVLMILGTINFVVYLLLLKGRLREAFCSTENYTIVAWAAFLVVLVSAILCREQIYSSIIGLFNHGTFMTITCISTCGMQTVYPQQFGVTLVDSVLVVLMLATLIGASSCSSSGGIKIFRIGQVLYWLAYTVKSSLLPNNAYSTLASGRTSNSRKIYPKDAMFAMVITLLYIVAAGLGAVCFIVHGFPALNSIFESISYVSNAGITTEITSASMPLDLKLIAIFQMWAGRLEFIALFALIAGLVMSALPKKENIPPRVQATRQAMRRAKRRKVFNKVYHNFFGSDNNKKTMSVLLVLVLVSSLCVVSAGGTAQAGAAQAGGGQVGAAQAGGGQAGTARVATDAWAGSVQASTTSSSFSASSAYRSVQIKDLLGASSRMDKKEITFTAEAIGTCIKADKKHVWVNFLQDGCEIGVYMNKKQAAKIKNFGAYKTQGDSVRIEGVFNLKCAQHADELEVHASKIKVVEQGSTWTVPYSKAQLFCFFVFLALGVCLIALRRLIYGRRLRIRFSF